MSELANTLGDQSSNQSTRDSLFAQLSEATDFQAILEIFRDLCTELSIDPLLYDGFYLAFKNSFTSWKTQALFQLLDTRAKQAEYDGQKACAGNRVLIIGAGPVGLRAAIEAAFLGAQVDVVEKRESFTRNNSLHLWPFLITDLKNLGAKKFYGRFCSSTIDHISIRILQSILLRVCLILGVKVYPGVTFTRLVEPKNANSGWTVLTSPTSSSLSASLYDMIIAADGKQNSLPGFRSKEFRAKLALAITANYVNSFSKQESSVPEISGVAYVYSQDFFNNLANRFGIELENIVYYKDETHYFVMTAKKASLIKKGVLKKDHNDPVVLLSKDNIDKRALECYATEAVTYSTDGALGDLPFEKNHRGENDVALFDFTSLFASENAARIVERKGKKILLCLVGDSLLEPFWPTGTGCARGFLGVFDAAWLMKRFSSGDDPLEILEERESILYLLPQTTPERLQKNHVCYSIDPKSRYLNLSEVIPPGDISHLYDTDNSDALILSRNQSIARSSTKTKSTSKSTGPKHSLSFNAKLSSNTKDTSSCNTPHKEDSAAHKPHKGDVSAHKPHRDVYAHKPHGEDVYAHKPVEAATAKHFWQGKQDSSSSSKPKGKESSSKTSKNPSFGYTKNKDESITPPSSKGAYLKKEKSSSPVSESKSESPSRISDIKASKSQKKTGSPKWFGLRGKNRRSRSESPEKMAKNEQKGAKVSAEYPLTVATGTSRQESGDSAAVGESQINVLDRIKQYNIKDAAVKGEKPVSTQQIKVSKDTSKSSAVKEKTKDSGKDDEGKVKSKEKDKTKHKGEDKTKKESKKESSSSKHWNPFKKQKSEVAKDSKQKEEKGTKKNRELPEPSSDETTAEIFSGVKNRIEKLKELGLMTDGVDESDAVLLSVQQVEEEKLTIPGDETDHQDGDILDSKTSKEFENEGLKREDGDEKDVDIGEENRSPSPEVDIQPSVIESLTSESPADVNVNVMDRVRMLQRSPVPPKRAKSFNTQKYKEIDLSELPSHSNPQESDPLWKVRVIQGLNKCLERLRKEVDIETAKATLEILNAIFSNVEKYPYNDVFRRVRVSGEEFTSMVWQYSEANQFLARSGWIPIDDFIVLPMGTSVDTAKRVIMKHLNIVNQMLWSMQLELPDSPATVIQRNKVKSKFRGRALSLQRNDSYATMLIEESMERIKEESDRRAVAAAMARQSSMDKETSRSRSISPEQGVDLQTIREENDTELAKLSHRKLEEVQTIKAATAARKKWEARSDKHNYYGLSLETALYDLPSNKLAESLVKENYVPSLYRRGLSIGNASSITSRQNKSPPLEDDILSEQDEENTGTADECTNGSDVKFSKENIIPSTPPPSPVDKSCSVSPILVINEDHFDNPVENGTDNDGEDSFISNTSDHAQLPTDRVQSPADRVQSPTDRVLSVSPTNNGSDQLRILTSASCSNDAGKKESISIAKSEKIEYEKLTIEAAALSREKWKQIEGTF